VDAGSLRAFFDVDDDVAEQGVGEPKGEVASFEAGFFGWGEILSPMKKESKTEVTGSHG